MSLSLYLGPYQPFLEEELAAAVRAFRQEEPLAPLVLLVSNRALVRHLGQALARANGGLFNLRVLTLHQYLLEFTEEKWIAEGFRLLPESLAPWILRENSRKVSPRGGPFAAVDKTPGFHKTLQVTLSELRQGGFTSGDLLASSKAVAKDKSRKRLSEKLAEFSKFFAENESWKKKNKWKDREDLYNDALTLSPPSTAIWTYGFYDASVLQKKVLEHLCSPPRRQDPKSKQVETGSKIKESRWFIPYEEHPAFEYAKPFVEWAKGIGEVRKVGKFESNKGTALGRLQNNLFKPETQGTPHPGSAHPLPHGVSQFNIQGEHHSPLGQGARESTSPSPSRGEGQPAVSEPSESNPDEGDFDSSDVKILLCPGEPREIREVVRVITEETQRRGTHFSQCGLLLRQLETYRRMIEPAFKGQGVPLAKAPSVFLMETPEAKALLLLLECFQSDFPRETLMDFLASPNLDFEGFGVNEEDWNPHLWDQASKEAGIVEGQATWLDRLKDLQKLKFHSRAEENEDLTSEESRSLSVFRVQVLQTLFDGRVKFENEKHWVGKTQVLFDLAEKIFLASKAKEELKTLKRGLEILSGDLKEVGKDELEPLLSDFMDEVKIPWAAPEFGGVEVSDLMQARGVPFDVVVLPGLVEQVFPRVPRQDPLLLDEERRILNERHQGQAKVPEKAEGRLEEKLLFLLAARSAQKCLVLTASHLHPGTGAPRVVSSYLHETLRVVTGQRLTQWDKDSPYFKKVAVSDWVKEGEQARVDDLEEVLSRFHEASKDPLAALAYLDEKPFFTAARKLLKERQGSRKFTRFDGIFEDPGAIKKLAQTNSLKEKTLSASRLETYAACPLRYFYRYVLGLKIHPEPERVFQLDPAEKGNLMHEVLEETLSRGVQEGWLTAREGEPAMKALNEETQKAFTRFEKEGIPGSPALWQWSKFIVRKDLEKQLKKVLEERDWTPVDFEKAFGRENQSEVAFATPAGKFHLEGFMDRVDLSSDGKKLRVVDYKSGKKEGFSKNSVKEGTKIQMPLYLWACRTLYPEVVPSAAVYEFITSKGNYGSVSFDASDWQKVEEPLKVLLTTASEAVDQGLFPAAAKACDHCDYRTLCGPGAENRGEKKKEDKRVAEYFKLEELI